MLGAYARGSGEAPRPTVRCVHRRTGAAPVQPSKGGSAAEGRLHASLCSVLMLGGRARRHDLRYVVYIVGQAPRLSSRAKVVRQPKGGCTRAYARGCGRWRARFHAGRGVQGCGGGGHEAQKKGASEEAPFITPTRREDLRLNLAAAAGSTQRRQPQREQRHRPRLGNGLDLASVNAIKVVNVNT